MPIWFLSVSHDNYLLPVLAETGLAELLSVREKSQVELAKPTSKKIFQPPPHDPNAVSLWELPERRKSRKIQGFTGELMADLKKTTGPKPETPEQIPEFQKLINSY